MARASAATHHHARRLPEDVRADDHRPARRVPPGDRARQAGEPSCRYDRFTAGVDQQAACSGEDDVGATVEDLDLPLEARRLEQVVAADESPQTSLR